MLVQTENLTRNLTETGSGSVSVWVSLEVWTLSYNRIVENHVGSIKGPVQRTGQRSCLSEKRNKVFCCDSRLLSVKTIEGVEIKKIIEVRPPDSPQPVPSQEAQKEMSLGLLPVYFSSSPYCTKRDFHHSDIISQYTKYKKILWFGNCGQTLLPLPHPLGQASTVTTSLEPMCTPW